MYGSMPFGKYKGEALADVPTDYLGWLLDNVELRPPLHWQVVEELRRRERPASPPPPTSGDMAGLVRRWFQGLARRYHADRGGSDAEMRVVNEAHDTLREALRKAGEL